MKLIFLVVTAYVFSYPELITYTNDDYRFEVQIPQQYNVESLRQEEKFGTIEYIKVSGREGSVGYTVVATRYTSNEAFRKTGSDFQQLVYNHAKHVSEESFLKNDFIILGENHRGNVLEYVVAEASTEMGMIRRIYIRKGMTYSLSMYCNKEFIKQENVEPFFKSLKIKP